MQSQKACILIISNEKVLNMCSSKYETGNFKTAIKDNETEGNQKPLRRKTIVTLPKIKFISFKDKPKRMFSHYQ